MFDRGLVGISHRVDEVLRLLKVRNESQVLTPAPGCLLDWMLFLVRIRSERIVYG